MMTREAMIRTDMYTMKPGKRKSFWNSVICPIAASCGPNDNNVNTTKRCMSEGKMTIEGNDNRTKLFQFRGEDG
jgi:hypothetical protein